MARDFVRQVQQLRKDADLEIEDRIRIFHHSADPAVTAALTEWADYIRSETQADALEPASAVPPDVKTAAIGEAKLPVWIVRA